MTRTAPLPDQTSSGARSGPRHLRILVSFVAVIVAVLAFARYLGLRRLR